MLLDPGSQVDKFRVIRCIGSGGMGAVFEAEHVLLGRPAALKVLHPMFATNPEIVQRFLNEAKAAAKLKHRNIISVQDVGTLADGQTWLALDYLDGESLKQRLDRVPGGVDLATIVHVIAEAANGLHTAHEAGIVHRDVKPDNLFLLQLPNGDFRVVVLDFGICKLQPIAGGGQTQDSAVLGTPAYMPLEQLKASRDVDRRCDVWALAAITWEMATGRRLYEIGDMTFPNFISMRLDPMERVPDPRELRPDLPERFAAVIMCGLARDREHRFASAKEYAVELGLASPATGWSPSGISIVAKYADELMPSDPDALTAGAPLRVVSEAVTDPLRATPPVPPPPRTAPTVAAVPAPGSTTLRSASGQVIASPPATVAGHGGARRSRAGLVIGGAVGLVAAGGLAIALVVSKSSSSNGDRAATAPADAAARLAAVDAGRPPAMSALAIVTDPPGAEVLVDGVSKGAAPVNVLAPVGTEVHVRAERNGLSPAFETVTVGADASTIHLTLTSLVDAGVAVPAPVDAAPSIATEPHHEPRHDNHKGRGGGAGSGSATGTTDHAGSGSGSGSGSGKGSSHTSANPDDVFGG